MADHEDEVEDLIYEGRLAGVFEGFRNYDTLFKFLGGSTWRQDEYLFKYHYLYSPMAKIVKVRKKKGGQVETFYIEIEGIDTRVKVKSAYV